MRCRFHFAELLSIVDVPLAGSKAACTTLANILLKAHVLNVSEKEKSLGCLSSGGKTSSPTNDSIYNVVVDIVL